MISLPPPQAQRRKPDGRSVQDAAAEAGMVLPDVAVLALQQGRVIEAIKLIRTANPGLDLARAKAAMERMQAQVQGGFRSDDGDDDGDTPAALDIRKPLMSARRPPTVAMGDPPGQLRWVLVVATLLAAAAWILLRGG